MSRGGLGGAGVSTKLDKDTRFWIYVILFFIALGFVLDMFLGAY